MRQSWGASPSDKQSCPGRSSRGFLSGLQKVMLGFGFLKQSSCSNFFKVFEAAWFSWFIYTTQEKLGIFGFGMKFQNAPKMRYKLYRLTLFDLLWAFDALVQLFQRLLQHTLFSNKVVNHKKTQVSDPWVAPTERSGSMSVLLGPVYTKTGFSDNAQIYTRFGPALTRSRHFHGNCTDWDFFENAPQGG